MQTCNTLDIIFVCVCVCVLLIVKRKEFNNNKETNCFFWVGSLNKNKIHLRLGSWLTGKDTQVALNSEFQYPHEISDTYNPNAGGV